MTDPRAPGDASPQLLAVAIEHEPGTPHATVRVSGEIDTASVDELHHALDQVVADGATEVRLDLARVEFMDSTGIAALLGARTKLEGRGKIVVEPASAAVQRVLEVAGLDVHFGTA